VLWREVFLFAIVEKCQRFGAVEKKESCMAAPSIQEIKEFHDIIRLLEEHPEWQADLRRVILTNDLLALPQQVARLIEAQTYTHKQIQTLAEAQQRTDAQLVTLTEAQKRTELQLGELADQVRTLVQIIQGQSNDIAKLKGFGLETHYRQHGASFFGTIIRRSCLVG
jgi:murein L,D-transpeptidase YcbB/YkuD